MAALKVTYRLNLDVIEFGFLKETDGSNLSISLCYTYMYEQVIDN